MLHCLRSKFHTYLFCDWFLFESHSLSCLKVTAMFFWMHIYIATFHVYPIPSIRIHDPVVYPRHPALQPLEQLRWAATSAIPLLELRQEYRLLRSSASLDRDRPSNAENSTRGKLVSNFAFHVLIWQYLSLDLQLDDACLRVAVSPATRTRAHHIATIVLPKRRKSRISGIVGGTDLYVF